MTEQPPRLPIIGDAAAAFQRAAEITVLNRESPYKLLAYRLSYTLRHRAKRAYKRKPKKVRRIKI